MRSILPPVAIAFGFAVIAAQDTTTSNPEAADLLFSSTRDGNSEVYVLRAGHKEWVNVSNHKAGDNWPVWSPDGKKIAFYSDNESSAALTVIGIDGKNRRTIVAEGYNWYPRWSADGRWLVYTAMAPGDGAENIDVFAVAVLGGARPILLAGGPSREAEGSWRPK